MPFAWVDPEICLMYRGVTVYHTYRNQSVNDRSECWFSLDDESDEEFDIRDLPKPEVNMSDKDIIRLAIDSGTIPYVIEKIEPFVMPEDWFDLPHHILQLFSHQYDNYIIEANDQDKYTEGWRPASLQEFYINEFQEYAEEREWIGGSDGGAE